jgi:hypothetical protein
LASGSGKESEIVQISNQKLRTLERVLEISIGASGGGEDNEEWEKEVPNSWGSANACYGALRETCWHAAMVDVELQKPPVWERENFAVVMLEKREEETTKRRRKEKKNLCFACFCFIPSLFAMCCSSKWERTGYF